MLPTFSFLMDTRRGRTAEIFRAITRAVRLASFREFAFAVVEICSQRDSAMSAFVFAPPQTSVSLRRIQADAGAFPLSFQPTICSTLNVALTTTSSSSQKIHP
jgi:hypothetical protein